MSRYKTHGYRILAVGLDTGGLAVLTTVLLIVWLNGPAIACEPGLFRTK